VTAKRINQHPGSEERVDPAAIAQGIGEVGGGLGGVGAFMVGVAKVKETFGSNDSAPPPPPTSEPEE
jgi:hypothetical protein